MHKLHCQISELGGLKDRIAGKYSLPPGNGFAIRHVKLIYYELSKSKKRRVNMGLTTLRGAILGRVVLLTLFLSLWNSGWSACSNFSPSFSYSLSKSCGVPVTVNFTNTTTGVSSTVASYVWKLGNTVFKTGVGKGTASYKISSAGSYTFKLVATDTGKSPCKDSVSVTVTISIRAPKIKDPNGVYSYAPEYYNCISTFGTPDTFGVFFEVQDTMNNYVIRWGDGNSNSGSMLLKTQSVYHKYTSLGVFTLMAISTKNGCTDTLYGVVINERQPVAGIIGPPTGTNGGCGPLKVRFINNSLNSSPATSFIWKMGDSTTYTLASTTYKDTLYHTYKRMLCNGVVTLTAKNYCGSSSATWNPIQVSTKDTAIIRPQNPTNCDLTKDFVFDNQSQNRFCSTPNPKKYTIIWGDGTKITGLTTTASQSHKYSARGTYTVLIIDSNTCGKDTGKYILKIDSVPKIKARATPKNLVSCPPFTVNFVDSSIGTVTTRVWDFHDPSYNVNQSSSVKASWTYKNSGTFKPILTISNSCGTFKDTLTVVAKQKVKAGIQPLSGYRCSPYTHTFVNTSTEPYPSATTYKWIFEDNSTSTAKTPASRTYSTAGNYTIKLIATDSCGSDTTSMLIQVLGKASLTASVISTSLCPKSPIQLRYTTGFSSSNVYWDHGDGTALYSNFGYTSLDHYHTYDSAKTYISTVRVVDPNGCKDTIKLPVVIKPRPTASFSGTKNGCGPNAVPFKNNSVHNGGGTFGQLSFVWNYGQGKTSTSADSTVTYFASKTKDTVYTIKLTVTNSFNCVDSTSQTVRVYPKPLSRFVLDKYDGCAPLVVKTQNTSIPYDTGSIYIMKFRWAFGNGTQAFRTDSVATYKASKTQDTNYSIRLIAISEHGCMDTSYKTVRVYPKPLSKFTVSAGSGCKPLNILMNNQSKPWDTGSISIMKFKWDFGNKTSSVLSKPGVVYTDKYNFDTTYTIRLIAESEHGCLDTSTGAVTLHPDPSIQFGPSVSGGCGPLTVNFSNTTLNGQKYFWDFSAYGTDTAKAPTKTFYGQDIFDSVVNVSLYAISKFNCKSDTVKQKVTVYGNPISAYLVSKDTFCFPDQMQFLNQSLAAYNYSWNLGDGTITTTTNPKHFFKKNPDPFRDTTYFIQLIARSPNGCRDTARGTMTVLPYPIPKFTYDNPAGCAPHKVNFTNNSINVKKYFWNLGDGYTSTLTNPNHTYLNTGQNDTAYKVTLYSYSADCVDTVSYWLNVYRPSYAFFRTDRVNPCDAGYFQFKSFAENANSVQYKFGDGTQSTLTDPLHLFPTSPWQDTSFTINFYTFSGRGCKDSFKRTVTLPQRLQIGMKDFSTSVCAPGKVQFTNYTKGAITYIWDFGDNGGSSQRNPLYNYQLPGTYQFKLYAFDPNGCVDSVKSVGTIRVDMSPFADFDYSPGKGRMPNDNRIYFTDKSRSTVPLTHKWDFSDPGGLTKDSITAKDASHDFTDSGWFKVCKMVSNGGCADTFCNLIRIEPPFPTPEFIVDRDSGCPQLTVKFTNQSINSDRYIWFFGDGDRSEEKDPVHTYKYSGYYDVTLVAKGPGGEGKTEKKYFIKVLNAPYTYFMVTPSVLFLPNADIRTRNLTTGAITYNWSVFRNVNQALVGTSTKFEPAFTVNDTGFYDVLLITISNQGCYDTLLIEKPLYVNPTGIMHVPDAFTPNKDDKNEVFRPMGINVQKDFYLFQIFNRWGEVVYETNDPASGWDGTYKDKLCQTGVYAYKVKARFYSGEEYTGKGVVHLMR
ncbi:MAG: PKD domain-containing protein [Bacteroidetes bacterium]|nr:PKD domain-containing protein [Bacteroidota bacterium]